MAKKKKRKRSCDKTYLTMCPFMIECAAPPGGDFNDMFYDAKQILKDNRSCKCVHYEFNGVDLIVDKHTKLRALEKRYDTELKRRWRITTRIPKK